MALPGQYILIPPCTCSCALDGWRIYNFLAWQGFGRRHAVY